MELQDYCNIFGLEKSGSKYRKFLIIGREASRFEEFIDRLPMCWTTLYALAALEKDKFLQVATQLTPTTTASDLALILEGKDDNSEERVSPDLTIDLGKFERSKKVEVCAKIEQLEKEFGFPLKVGQRLANELQPKEKKKKEKLSLAHLLDAA